MRSPQPMTVVIACPHCGTRYQVPPETLGSKGRSVACAHCGQSWLAEAPKPGPRPQQDPEPKGEDRLFTPSEEEQLDREFTAAEARNELADVPSAIRKLLPKDGAPPPPEVMKSIAEIKAAIAPRVPEPPPEKPKAPEAKAEKPAKSRKHGLPLARLYPAIRALSVAALVGIVAGALWFRTDVVRALPDTAGLYAAIGMGVNVVGLEFSDVTTLSTRRGQDMALTVAAKIRSATGKRVAVPPVVVTLLDDHGAELYEWSVMPPADDVAPGEVVELTAELATPPAGAAEVRLSFAEGRRARTAPRTAAAASEPAAPIAADIHPAEAEPQPAHTEEAHH